MVLSPGNCYVCSRASIGIDVTSGTDVGVFESVESSGLADSRGLALWLSSQPPVLALPMGIFYLLLIGITLAIAFAMVRRKGVEPESKREVEVKT